MYRLFLSVILYHHHFDRSVIPKFISCHIGNTTNQKRGEPLCIRRYYIQPSCVVLSTVLLVHVLSTVFPMAWYKMDIQALSWCTMGYLSYHLYFLDFLCLHTQGSCVYRENTEDWWVIRLSRNRSCPRTNIRANSDGGYCLYYTSNVIRSTRNAFKIGKSLGYCPVLAGANWSCDALHQSRANRNIKLII